MIALIGSEGSMGKRYQAILSYLKTPVKCFDREHTLEDILKGVNESKAVIIASPTATHAEYLRQILPLRKKVLCEKPLIKDIFELRDIFAFCSRNGYQLNMMMQYSEIVHSRASENSHYDYFRSGPDGLIWDCLQIIALARGPVSLNNKSPVWNCKINGQQLSIAAMDGAYLSVVDAWMNNRYPQTFETLLQHHIKTAEMAGEY